MFATQIIRRTTIPARIRQFTRSAGLRDSKSSGKTQTTAGETAGSSTTSQMPTQVHYVSPFDRFVLVWVKRYPNKEAVPKTVSLEVMYQARNKARIRTCNYMIALSVIGFIIVATRGKKHRADVIESTDSKAVREYYKAMKDENPSKLATK